MKKNTPKKNTQRAKGPRKKKSDEFPMEFDRSWQELEAQHDRIKSDWLSLAAQIGLDSDPKKG